MMVGIKKPVRVKVLSCLGSQPSWSTFFPLLAKATEILQLVVDLPIPPLPYTASFTLIFLLCYLRIDFLRLLKSFSIAACLFALLTNLATKKSKILIKISIKRELLNQ